MNALMAFSKVMTKSLALELAQYYIRVNCINPVAAATPMMKQFLTHFPSYQEGVKTLVATILLGRLAQPEDVAYAALYLASDESAFITGVALPVAGGRSV